MWLQVQTAAEPGALRSTEDAWRREQHNLTYRGRPGDGEGETERGKRRGVNGENEESGEHPRLNVNGSEIYRERMSSCSAEGQEYQSQLLQSGNSE